MSADTENPKDLIGIKKPNIHLVPPALVIWAAKAMENGASKYGPFNWRQKKVRATIYISAAMRHLYAFLDGEDFADDSGIHHAAHAAACLGIILDARECDCLIDDRPPKGPAASLMARLTTAISEVEASAQPRRRKVYIAGPMRGIKDFNFSAFYAAEEKLRARGYEVFNPARRDAQKYGGNLKSETGSEEEITAAVGFSIRDAMAVDTAWIATEADAIYMLRGWESSKGAHAEITLAKAIGLDILWEEKEETA